MMIGPIVVDTSVQLASEMFATPGSPAREVIARAFARHFDLAMSDRLIAELARKMVELGAPVDAIIDHLANLRAIARWFADVDVPGIACADPDDVFVIALAITSESWCIVADDKALLAERLPPGLQPGPFLARLRELRGEPAGTRFK